MKSKFRHIEIECLSRSNKKHEILKVENGVSRLEKNVYLRRFRMPKPFYIVGSRKYYEGYKTVKEPNNQK